MQMYRVKAVTEDLQTVLQEKIFFAQDEEDALDQMEDFCREEKISYGFCLAEEA